MTPLRWLAGRGPWVLVAGILAGLTLPGLAEILVPFIPHMVAGLLFLAALRIGPNGIFQAVGSVGRDLRALLILQFCLPLILVLIFRLFGVLETEFATATVLIGMASSIAGAPNMIQMMGRNGADAMRLLILGTTILPVTVIPILWLLPNFGSVFDVVSAALRLLVVIFLAGGLALLIRRVLPEPGPDRLAEIDGASALLLAIVVIGLMSAVNEAIRETPGIFMIWLGFVFLVNFGLQALGFLASHGAVPDRRAALSVIAGNRNIALFLVALPPEITGPLLVFIGCYQVPMYLTPLVTGWVLRKL